MALLDELVSEMTNAGILVADVQMRNLEPYDLPEETQHRIRATLFCAYLSGAITVAATACTHEGSVTMTPQLMRTSIERAAVKLGLSKPLTPDGD